MKSRFLTAFVVGLLASMGTATTLHGDIDSKTTRSITYITLGASFTYGVGADGNVIGEDLYEPGSGGAYTSQVVDKLVRFADVAHFNTAIPGQTSGQILATQTEGALSFLADNPADRTFVEVASGGNDLLGFLLFPRSLPPLLEPARDACYRTEPASNGRFEELYIFQDSPICEGAISQIIANAQRNLTALIDSFQAQLPASAKFLVRNYPNPVLSTPAEFGGAPCLSLVEQPALYGVRLTEAVVNKYLDGISSDGDFLGLNPMIAEVANEKGVTLVNIEGTLAGTNVFADCVHPNQEGHDQIFKRVIKAIKSH
ncbi:MAG: hypothetical protein HRU19_21205 [Pseudobacteriovorax sp.]|nr:hypothetical protein [Pseudobacteriovorax sp.]